MFTLKEKFKLIKENLKEWHKYDTQNMEGKIKYLKEELNRIEIKRETGGLMEEEMNRKREITILLDKVSNLNCSIQWKIARSMWLKE